MENKIPLPRVRLEKEHKAHPFPYQISYQTLETIQATLFWHICADIASGKILRTTDDIKTIEHDLATQGMPKKDWEDGWEYLSKYLVLFERMIFKNVLISMRSYWDWYINNLAKFIIYGQDKLEDTLSNKHIKLLERISFKEIQEQVIIIENACKLDFEISNKSKMNIKEMSLVRNLGLHNRWEIDDIYLNKTLDPDKWQVGEIRVFDDNELRLWHKSLVEFINKTCKQVAMKYASVPSFP